MTPHPKCTGRPSSIRAFFLAGLLALTAACAGPAAADHDATDQEADAGQEQRATTDEQQGASNEQPAASPGQGEDGDEVAKERLSRLLAAELPPERDMTLSVPATGLQVCSVHRYRADAFETWTHTQLGDGACDPESGRHVVLADGNLYVRSAGGTSYVYGAVPADVERALRDGAQVEGGPPSFQLEGASVREVESGRFVVQTTLGEWMGDSIVALPEFRGHEDEPLEAVLHFDEEGRLVRLEGGHSLGSTASPTVLEVRHTDLVPIATPEVHPFAELLVITELDDLYHWMG